MQRRDFDDFVTSYLPGRPRSDRVETELFKPFTYDEILARDKANMDLIWLKDDSLQDAADLPAPDVLAREIIEELEVALAEFIAIAESLEELVGSEDDV
jgi:type I restriction enzyme M protein